jgi:hypothetical protein
MITRDDNMGMIKQDDNIGMITRDANIGWKHEMITWDDNMIW